MIGSIVGNYRVLEKIGSGGMGEVYKGIDIMLEREVAIKILHPELALRPDVVERFRTEAVTLARLNHPNIATLFSFFKHGDSFFMIMEYVPGKTLAALMQHSGLMTLKRAIAIMGQALEGIAHAHGEGIIHRDLKPANIMLTGKEQTKVMDFGIARVLGSARMTRAGHLVGTIEYMSPEQIRGEEGDARSDIYSMGIVLYEALTGRVPFSSDSDYELMRQQIEKVPDPPTAFAPHIPPRMEAAILTALQKNPSLRFQTTSDFREELLSASGQQVSPARVAALVPPTRLSATGQGQASTLMYPAETRVASVDVPMHGPEAPAAHGSHFPAPVPSFEPAAIQSAVTGIGFIKKLSWIHFLIASAAVMVVAGIMLLFTGSPPKKPEIPTSINKSTPAPELPSATKTSPQGRDASSNQSRNPGKVDPDSIPGVLPPREAPRKAETPTINENANHRGGGSSKEPPITKAPSPEAKRPTGDPHDLLRRYIKKDKKKEDR